LYKRQQIRDRVDPIERLIDWQMRSIWRAHQLESTRRQIKVADTGRAFNAVEDMFIEALDRKYHAQVRLDILVFDYFTTGYTIRDIESLTGLGRSSIWRRINRVVSQLEDGVLRLEDL